MPRPGFVLEVDERTPPLLVHQGEGFRLQKFPLGARVVYPPDSLPGLPDPNAAVRNALLDPIGTEPLPELLRPGMKLTIAVDDISLPLPPMKAPDVRQRVLESVLEIAARRGVDDVRIVMANSLHRRMTPVEMKHAVGERVYRSFWPEALSNHDAEDPQGMVTVGETDRGEVVEINRRAAESDLLVYVNINLVAMDGGHKSVPVGLAGYRSLKHHHNVRTMLHSNSYMDPPRSALHSSTERMGRLLAEHLKIFTIESTLNNDTFPSQLGFLNKREWEWSARDQAKCLGLGYFFNMYLGKPVVRPGGVMILFHPVPWEFHQVHHPSYVDFFEEVLAETTDPAQIEAKFEEQYATDPWYIHLYRNSYAYHGVHPFYMWYWGAHAMDYLGDVIFVGADRKAVRRMGFRTATTFADALEMAGETVGSSPSITYLHSPPLTLAEVR